MPPGVTVQFRGGAWRVFRGGLRVLVTRCGLPGGGGGAGAGVGGEGKGIRVGCAGPFWSKQLCYVMNEILSE